MRISLATSLHLDHGARPLDCRGGAPLTMQAFVPVGLLSLKASCDAAHPMLSVNVTELNTLINAGAIPNDDDFYDHVAQTVIGGGDDVVGLMTDADSLHHTMAIARRVKARAPRALVGLGGPAVTPIAQTVLKRFEAVDFIVRGEGEETFPQLLGAFGSNGSFADILGLTWRQGDTVHHNADRRVMEDLDRLPIPDFAAYNRTAEAALYLDVGRGCPFKCAFCATAPFWERRYRMKSIPRILEEMRLLRDGWGRRHFNYSHDIFTCDNKWTHAFCGAMKTANLGVTWTCSTRTDVIDPELLAHMAEAGCVEIYYGIETGSQVMQKVIQKNLDLNWSREIVKATTACGIRPVTGFIVGYPEETEETFADTVARFFDFLEVGGYRAHIFSLCPFPGAPMFARDTAIPDRRAEYLDLPVASRPACEAEQLIADQPDVFASHYRFKTPGVPASYVAAAEEVSAHMVLLKRIWPLLLPHYEEPAVLFRRWVAWIAEQNLARPWRARHHGNAADLIDFVTAELAWLEIGDERIRDLVSYEALKLAAASLPIVEQSHDSSGGKVFEIGSVRQARPFLIAAFQSDIGQLVSGRRMPANDIALPQWVVFAREPAGTVNTHVIGEAARRVLEYARAPRSIVELVRAAVLDTPARDSPDYSLGIETVQALTASNLLQEVIPS
ncbi:MAG: radical SAM protein [Reyranella sp.]|nr:radical SAM protein [Reyranella sp.]